MRYFRHSLLIFFLLVFQSGTVAHAVDHEIADHGEWCLALSASDNLAAVDAPVTMPLTVETEDGLLSSDFLTVFVVHSSVYASRAPPRTL